MKKIFLLLPLFLVFLLQEVMAHCPLCTIGAAAVSVGALGLGVNNYVVGIFIGAFAVSTGWWLSNLIKKKYFKGQRALIILASFLLTIIPLLPILGNTVSSIYISLFGNYGSLLNRTYIINPFLIGSIYGGFLVTITPALSNKLTNLRKGKHLPYQGIILTFVLLLISAVVIQLV